MEKSSRKWQGVLGARVALGKVPRNRRLSGKSLGKKQEDNRHLYLVSHTTPPHGFLSAVASHCCDPFPNTESGLCKCSPRLPCGGE